MEHSDKIEDCSHRDVCEAEPLMLLTIPLLALMTGRTKSKYGWTCWRSCPVTVHDWISFILLRLLILLSECSEIIRIKKKQTNKKQLNLWFYTPVFSLQCVKPVKLVLIIVLTCNPLPTHYVISGFWILIPSLASKRKLINHKLFKFHPKRKSYCSWMII